MHLIKRPFIKAVLLTLVLSAQIMLCNGQSKSAGKTEITEWQFGKNGAVSITYDDGSYNQFKEPLPIMQNLNLPATFFIITSGIPQSKYHDGFNGRPVKHIMAESATIPTN